MRVRSLALGLLLAGMADAAHAQAAPAAAQPQPPTPPAARSGPSAMPPGGGPVAAATVVEAPASICGGVQRAPGAITVSVAQPGDPKIDRSMRLRQLTRAARDGQLAYDRGNAIWGMTDLAAIGHIDELQFGGTLVNGALCVYPTIARVTLQADQTIKVARESPSGSCWDRLVLARERQHVLVNQAVVTDAAHRIEDGLDDLALTSTHEGFSDLQVKLAAAVTDLVNRDLAAAAAAGKGKHADIEGTGPVYNVRSCM